MPGSYIASSPVAASVPFDNVTSGLAATDTQAALDLLAAANTYNLISSTAFTSAANVDTFITGMTLTPVSGTYAILFNASATPTTNGQEVDCTIYKAGSAIADSKRPIVSPANPRVSTLSTMTVSQFNGSQTCQVYVDPNGSSVTVNQRCLLLIRLGP